MSIAIITSGASAIETYGGLKQFIIEHLQLAEEVSDRLGDLIRMAEYRLQRLILTPDREITAGVNTVAGIGSVTLPAGLKQLRSAYVNSSPQQGLEITSPATLQRDWNGFVSGVPTAICVSGGGLLLAPTPDAVYTISLTYLQSIAYLSDDNPTNWLLAGHADAYVYATLLQCEAFIGNDDRLPLWKQALDETIMEINDQGNRLRYSGVPVRLRNPSVCV